jgi:GTP-binding protein EngB required for normal cell division
MKKTLDTFKNKQEKALTILRKIENFLKQGEELGVSIDSGIRSKLVHAIDNLDGEKLKVALIGGFSEGKTSIAAAWMGKLDKSTMKISHQESSNEVKIYDLGDDLTLIDTPGLFGFKEQENPETHQIEKFKDITKKYVSEAHLILYVMNSTNPIKESHKEDLNWLFRNLNLLSRTVFVLSRFDEVADVEDEDEYQEALAIKKVNVIGRLTDLISLTDAEVAQISIVGISANPFDLGTDYWLSNLEKFKVLSHISSLQDVTSGKVSSNGGIEFIIEETKKTIIRDILNKQLPVAIDNDQRISSEVEKLNVANIHLQRLLGATNQDISEVRIHLRDFVVSYFSGLILQVNGVNIETFNDFFEREVGSAGIVINNKLQNEFERQLRSINQEIGMMQVSYQAEVEHYNSTVMQFGRQGLKYALKGKFVNKETVMLARDGLVSTGKFIGIDLSKMLKFKPWGATNLAKGLNGALAAAGLAFELWDTWQEAKKNEEFRAAILKMKENFEQQREELISLINSENFVDQFFPSYMDLRINFEDVTQGIAERKTQQAKFHEWRKNGENIDVEFSMI